MRHTESLYQVSLQRRSAHHRDAGARPV